MGMHTPEPWVLRYDDGDCAGTFTILMGEALASPGWHNSAHLIELYDGAWDESEGDPEEAAGSYFEECKANSERIVAAVNACAGLDTEALEAGVIADQQLLLRALAAGKANLIPSGSTAHITVWSGRDFLVTLDASGLPVLTPEIRAALTAALEGE